MVCLERLKILVSRLPPHGRRQSDPLPASGMEKSEAPSQQRVWGDGVPEVSLICFYTVEGMAMLAASAVVVVVGTADFL